jgi:hypothetical protein
MSTQPEASRGPGVSDAQWQALVAGVRDMAEKVAGLSRRMAALEQQVSPRARPVSARRRSSAQ